MESGMTFNWGMIVEYQQLFIGGALNTLKLAILAVCFGIIIGVFLGVARVAEAKYAPWSYLLKIFVRWPANVYVTFFRGTPLFVQIMLVHFAFMPLLINADGGLLISGDLAKTIRQNYGAFASGLLALSLNSGAYITEIVRAGIQSIDKGQTEAARSLGLSYKQTMLNIILPQAFRRMLPPLGNETITLLKDSSLVAVIGYGELAYAAKSVAGAYSRFWEPYLTISCVYLVLTMSMAYGVSRLEKKYKVKTR
jgi:polar amino acid transport system permease protein